MMNLIRLFFRATILPWVQLCYRVRRIGMHNVPARGGALLLPNHVTYIDSFIIFLTCPRPVRFVVVDHYMDRPFSWFLKLFRAIPIDQSNPRDAIVKSVNALQAGDVVCLFAEGGLTRTGLINDLKKGFELIARRSGCPVIPCYMDGLWESIFSAERGKYLKKWPLRIPCPVQVVFGDPFPAEEAKIERIFEGILQASVEAFAARGCFKASLESEVIDCLKTKGRRNFSFEHAKTPRSWSRAQFLGLAIAMARRWINSPPDERQRIGILLPPGPTPAVLNLGLFLAGKTPVNLPFDLTPQKLESLAPAMEKIGIRTVITSKAFLPHLADFWRGGEGRFIDIASELAAPGRLVLSLESFLAKFEPGWLTSWRLQIKQRDQEREALGLIVSSEQDAVFLSCSQVFRNAMQITAAEFLRERETLFSEMPMNSAVGQMMQLWVPILSFGRTVGRGFSMRNDEKLLRRICEDEGVTVLVGDLPFYRQIEKPLEMSPLRYGLIFDDEADTAEIERCEELIKLPLARGWECFGRIISMSLPPYDPFPATKLTQMFRKSGTVGRFLPGIAGRIQGGVFSLLLDAPAGPRNRRGREKKSPRAEPDWIEVGPGVAIDREGYLVLRSEGDKKTG